MTTVLGVPQISEALLKDLAKVGRKYKRWTAQAYFELDGTYLVEYCRGRLEILPMPTLTHQRVAKRLLSALDRHVTERKLGGEVLFAGTRVKVAEETFREPDVLYIPAGWASPAQDEYTERAALVIEVVSESNREHDLQTKRAEYAHAGIPEYWLADPEMQRVTVLVLDGGHYAVHGEFRPGQKAVSALLAGFEVDVAALFAEAEQAG